MPAEGALLVGQCHVQVRLARRDDAVDVDDLHRALYGHEFLLRLGCQ